MRSRVCEAFCHPLASLELPGLGVWFPGVVAACRGLGWRSPRAAWPGSGGSCWSWICCPTENRASSSVLQFGCEKLPLWQFSHPGRADEEWPQGLVETQQVAGSRGSRVGGGGWSRRCVGAAARLQGRTGLCGSMAGPCGNVTGLCGSMAELWEPQQVHVGTSSSMWEHGRAL